MLYCCWHGWNKRADERCVFFHASERASERTRRMALLFPPWTASAAVNPRPPFCCRLPTNHLTLFPGGHVANQYRTVVPSYNVVQYLDTWIHSTTTAHDRPVRQSCPVPRSASPASMQHPHKRICSQSLSAEIHFGPGRHRVPGQLVDRVAFQRHSPERLRSEPTQHLEIQQTTECNGACSATEPSIGSMCGQTPGAQKPRAL